MTFALFHYDNKYEYFLYRRVSAEAKVVIPTEGNPSRHPYVGLQNKIRNIIINTQSLESHGHSVILIDIFVE